MKNIFSCTRYVMRAKKIYPTSSRSKHLCVDCVANTTVPRSLECVQRIVFCFFGLKSKEKIHYIPLTTLHPCSEYSAIYTEVLGPCRHRVYFLSTHHILSISLRDSWTLYTRSKKFPFAKNRNTV
jgi:hypothetical protein